jgi:hypothetical protein
MCWWAAARVNSCKYVYRREDEKQWYSEMTLEWFDDVIQTKLKNFISGARSVRSEGDTGHDTMDRVYLTPYRNFNKAMFFYIVPFDGGYWWRVSAANVPMFVAIASGSLSIVLTPPEMFLLKLVLVYCKINYIGDQQSAHIENGGSVRSIDLCRESTVVHQ